MTKRNQDDMSHSKDAQYGGSKAIRSDVGTKHNVGDFGTIEQRRKFATETVSADSVRFIPRQVSRKRI